LSGKKNISLPYGRAILSEMIELCINIQEYQKALIYVGQVQRQKIQDIEPIEVGLLSRIASTFSHLGDVGVAQQFISEAIKKVTTAEELDELYKISSFGLFLNGHRELAEAVIDRVSNKLKYIVDIAHIKMANNNFELHNILSKFPEAVAKYPKLNRSKTTLTHIDDIYLRKHVMITRDCGFGDILSFIPLMEQAGRPCTIHLNESEYALLHNLELEFVNFSLEEQDLPYLSSHLIPYITNFKDLRPIDGYITVKITGDNIGLTTQGNKAFANNKHRSIPNNKLGEIFDNCLKLGNVKMLNYGETFQPTTWLDTLNELTTCKQLISVDTGIANLAGAINLPNITLVRPGYDWRYAGGVPFWKTQKIQIMEGLDIWKLQID
jgi:hypothetical protein